MKMLDEGILNGKPVITRGVSLADALGAFDLAAGKSQWLKVLIAFDQSETTQATE